MSFGPNPDSWILRTDKDDHFTTALAQNAIDLETVDKLKITAVVISRVTIWSVENLDWDVMFFRNATSQPSADADLDSMVDWVRLPGSEAVQVTGSTLFRYSVSGINIRYQPDDGAAHIGLVNRSVAAKSAGAGGELVIELQGPSL